MSHETSETVPYELNPEAEEAAEIRALLPQAADFFRLGTLTHITPTPFGIGNESFFITTELGDFVLRVLWEQTIEGLKKEVAIEQQLAKANILSAQLLKGENDEHYFTDGNYTITASRKIAGTHPAEFTPELLYAVGTTMAQFHGAVTELPSETGQWLNHEKAIAETNKVTHAKWEGTIKDHLATGATLFTKGLPTGYIHGDLYAGNLIETPDKNLAILDFETTEHNVLILDIARTILDMCVDNTTVKPDLVQQLLNGYEAIRQLTEEEKNNLKQAILYVSGAMAAWLLVEREQEQVAQDILQRAESF